MDKNKILVFLRALTDDDIDAELQQSIIKVHDYLDALLEDDIQEIIEST